MTSEQMVKMLFPDATIGKEQSGYGRDGQFKVTIKPGRYAYGRMKSWAWKSALESIQQDKELMGGAL